MRKIILTVMLIFGSVPALCLAADPAWKVQEYKPAPVDNPLKGLVPHDNEACIDSFPHSMEFLYLPLCAVVTDSDRYDWRALEKFLTKTSQRGMHAIVRFYLEYPAKPSGVPTYLIQEGLKFTYYERPSHPPRPSAKITVPDYENLSLRRMLIDFIHAFGQKYDGDPRLGFIEAGLLGHWGEWHSSPRDELFASKKVQAEIMDSYESSFHRTKVVLRYPAGENDPQYISNAKRSFGYHDDSFAWSTLPVKDWYFMTKLVRAGEDAINKWKTLPIGGEIRPEAMGIVFDEIPGRPEVQDFRTCVDATHVSWLMDGGMFKAGNSEDRRARAMTMVRKVGYEFFVSHAAVSVQAPKHISVSVRVENRGVAPFYYRWMAEYALVDTGGNIIKIIHSNDTLIGLLPGDPPREWQTIIDASDVPIGTYRVLVRIQNPLPLGKPLRFANTMQDADISGWLTLERSVQY
jgi:hypothetical protein